MQLTVIYIPTSSDPLAYVGTVDSSDRVEGIVAENSHVQIKYENQNYPPHIVYVHRKFTKKFIINK